MAKPYVLDMETGDPDDVLTLLYLLGHPDVDLVAVTVTPGTPHQIGMVKHVLGLMGADIPIGSFDIGHRPQKRLVEYRHPCVSAWHYRTFGENIPASKDADVGWELLARTLTEEMGIKFFNGSNAVRFHDIEV